MTTPCPICRDRNSRPVYSVRRQPLLLNHLYETREAACSAPTADLSFRECRECGFVWNAVFDSRSIVYGPGYINDQSESAVFRDHLDEVMNRLLDRVADAPGSIIEIGCGQGTFLKSVCRRASRPGIGFDPALRGTAVADGDIVLRGELFTARTAGELMETCQPISLIVCRHVLEHLTDPQLLVETIEELMRTNSAATLYLEVPAVQWIADHAAFFDFFNEHCSLFGVQSMRRMLVKAGFSAVHIEPVFQGQYLAIEANLRCAKRTTPTLAETSINHDQWSNSLLAERNRWIERFDDLLDTDPVLIWGAGAKGISLVNQLELSFEQIPFLIDINPSKQGRFAPVTAQQVIGPQALRQKLASLSPSPTVIVMNPNYIDEVAKQLRDLGVKANIESIGGSKFVEVHN